MAFLEHVAELRQRLMIVVITVVVLALGLYTWGWEIFDFVLKPVMPYLREVGMDQLNLRGPFDGFTLRFKVGTYAAIVIGSPIIIWQVMAFFLPALKPREKRYVIPTFLALILLFLAGVVFCYTLILPPAFQWMVGQASADSVGVLPDATLWFQAVILVMLAFGVGFELPVIVFYLLIFNIVPYEKLRRNWRVAYVLITILAAMATPDWSPVTMGTLAVALILLYEASLLLARGVLAKRIREQKAREAAEAAGLETD